MTMHQHFHRPAGAIALGSYAELEQFAGAFGQGLLNLLILVGAAGLQKSRVVREAVGAGATYIEGNATAFGLYCDLWEGRDRPVVLDDVDGLYADRNAVRLLKSLCQTEAVKTVAWNSTVRLLDRRDIPRQFGTRSRVAIIANDWRSLNANVVALEDRAHVVVFEPSALEVHHRVATWFRDQEVFDFLGRHLHLIPSPSMRHYARALELKRAGMDWRSTALGPWLSGPALLVAKLKADPSFDSEEDRVRAFIKQGGGCRSSYFNNARKLQPPAEPPNIDLAANQPGVEGGDSDLLGMLRRRHGLLGNG
jgi:hypothetical protein